MTNLHFSGLHQGSIRCKPIRGYLRHPQRPPRNPTSSVANSLDDYRGLQVNIGSLSNLLKAATTSLAGIAGASAAGGSINLLGVTTKSSGDIMGIQNSSPCNQFFVLFRRQKRNQSLFFRGCLRKRTHTPTSFSSRSEETNSSDCLHTRNDQNDQIDGTPFSRLLFGGFWGTLINFSEKNPS